MEFERLIRAAQQGDRAARDELVCENMGLVWSVVRRFKGRGQEMEDLFQIGSIGLLKAIDKFDLSFQVCFSTYAVPLIAGEIRRFLRDDGIYHGRFDCNEAVLVWPGYVLSVDCCWHG